MGSLHCNLNIDQMLPAGEPVILRLTLNNSGEQPLEVLQYYTAFEGILGEIFSIQYGDESLSYQGPLVKRGPPTDEDWLLLEPGAELTAEVDLNGAWNLERPGDYTLQLKNDMTYRHSGSKENLLFAAGSCQMVDFRVL